MCGFVLERKGDEVCFQPLPGPSVWQAHCRAKETQEVAAIAALRVCSSLHGFFLKGMSCPLVRNCVAGRRHWPGKDTTGVFPAAE